MRDFSIAAVIVAIVLGIAIGFFTPLGGVVLDRLGTWWSPAPEETPVPESMSMKGEDIAQELAEFLVRSQRDDGSFFLRWKCAGSTCELVPEERNIFGYAAFGLAMVATSTGNEKLQEASQRSMARMLELCQGISQTCSYNFFPLLHALRSTKDGVYRAALLKAASSTLSNVRSSSIEASAGGRQFSKMRVLYTLTKNDYYPNFLRAVADNVLGRWPDEIKGDVLYTTSDGYDVRLYMPLIASDLFLATYHATGDEKYLNEVQAFFKEANISRNLPAFGWERGMEAVVQSMEGLLALSRIEAVPPAEQDAYAEEARTIMREILKWQYDSEKNSLFDGSNSIVTGVLIRGDYSGVNYKNTGLNGRVAGLLTADIFSEESFDVVGAP